MTMDDEIRNEKLQYHINIAAAKVSALSLTKVDKNDYLTDEVMLPPQQHRIIQEDQFLSSPLGKVFEKQTKMIENRGEKQVESPQSLKPNKQQMQAHQPQQQMKLLEDIFPKALLNNEV